MKGPENRTTCCRTTLTFGGLTPSTIVNTSPWAGIRTI